MIPLDGRRCRITHGPNESIFKNIEGKSVASVRRCVATVFSIPDIAEAYIDGSVVGPEYRLRAGDHLTFSKQWGSKGSEHSGPPFRPGDPCPSLLTEEEAIRYLRLDTIDIANPADTLRRYRNLGLLRGTQVSKKVFYLRAELDAFLVRVTGQNPR
jgi:hypothetical protein